MKQKTLVLMVLLALTGSDLFAQTVTESSRQTPPDYKHSNTRFGNYPCSYFTPRIEWGRPLAVGTLNLLIFVPMEAAREPVELVSRLDAKADLVTTTFRAYGGWWKGWTPGGASFYDDIPNEQALNERATVLLSPAYAHNVIIIGKIKWSAIPEDIRARILEKVKGGAGLILVSPKDMDPELEDAMQFDDGDDPLAESIKATVPLAKLPLDLDLEPLTAKGDPPRKIGPLEIRTGKLGEGKVVFLQYNDLRLKNGKDYDWDLQAGLTPSISLEDDDLFYNYYMSILAKAVLYAAGKESGARVRPEVGVTEIARGKLPATPVTFSVSSTNRILPGTSLYYEIRDRNNRVIARGEQELPAKDGGITFAPSFPVFKQGLYLADAWLKRRGMTLDWASAAVSVTDTVYFTSVVADKEYFSRNEGISGSITLKEPLPSGHKIVVELWDTYNRLEQRVVLKSGETKFGFNRIQRPLSRTYRIVAKVESGDAVLDEQEAWTGLPSNELDEFQFMMDGPLPVPTTRTGKTYMRLFKEFGITAYDDENYSEYKLSADAQARNNFKAFYYICHMGGFCVGDPPEYRGTGRIGDFQKNTWKEGHREWYRPRIESYRRYGTLAYGVNNECGIAEDQYWNNPIALKDYRIYLKGRYGDIANLNKIWRAAFGSFDDIAWISFLDARTGRQSTRWLEQELYKRDRYSGVHEYCADLIKEFDPGARVGIAIAHETSYDIPRMAKNGFSFVQSDLENFDKENRDRINAGYYVGFYQGETSEWHMRTKAWESLFRGGNAICWWPSHNNVTKDLSEPFLCFKQISEEVRDVHSGIDRLLMSADKRLDPILILWSNNSRIAGVYNPLETEWLGAVSTFMNMLRRVGLDYQCVGEDFVEGKLQFGAKQRVLVLPASQSISRKSVEQIKAFAKAGGLVIADYRPAVMDEYLRPYGGETPKGAPAVAQAETCPKCNGKKIIHLGGAGDPLGACTTCGGTGVVIKGDQIIFNQSALDEMFDFTKKGAKKFGNGYGLFLAGAPAVDEWRALRNTLIEKSGIKGDIEVLDVLGNSRTDLRTYVFDSGPAMLVGVLPDKTLADPPGEEFILKINRKMHIYNVRLRSYLGYADSVTAGILPAQAKLFALLPARIDGLTVRTNQKDYRPGETVTLEIKTIPDTLKDVSLAVRVEALLNGKVISAYTKKLAVKGSVTHQIPLALNEAKGAYALRTTEIISGQQQEMKFFVK